MNKVKPVLLDFIRKYHLGGTIESVKWDVKDETITTSVIAEDKTLIGNISHSNVPVEDMEVGIYTTSNLVKILDVFEDRLELDVNRVDGDKPVNFELNDGNTNARFVLASVDVIPAAPKSKQMPDFTARIPIDSNLINRIVKAKNALPDISHITFNTNDDVVEIIIGYSKNNRSNISFKVEADVTGDINYKSFNSNYLVEIFKANPNMKEGYIEIANAGLAHVYCAGTDFTCDYYLVEVTHI